MHIAEALEVRVLIVAGLGTGHQNAQASKTISFAQAYIGFFSLSGPELRSCCCCLELFWIISLHGMFDRSLEIDRCY